MKGLYSQLDEAKHAVVHDYLRDRNSRQRGASALAPLVGMNPGTLCNKVNPLIDTHHLTVDEAVAIQNAAHDYRILEAEANTLGFIILPVGDFDLVSDMELLDAYTALHERLGCHAKTLHETLADGKVERSEAEQVRRALFEAIQEGFELQRRLEGLIRD